MNSYGCLEKYVNLIYVIDKGFAKELIDRVSITDGFLCNYQIPLVSLLGNDFSNIVEIGCWHGRATVAFNVFKNDNRKMWCVDTFEGSEEHQERLQGRTFKEEFKKNIEPLKNITVVQNTSENAAKDFDDNFFDLVWIDASHDYYNVKLDINSWLPKLKRGGLMIGHDYPEPDDKKGGFEELVKAVDEEVKNDDRFQDFGWFCGIWGGKKL